MSVSLYLDILAACLTVYLSVCLSPWPSVCLPASHWVCVPYCLCCLTICPSNCLSVCPTFKSCAEWLQMKAKWHSLCWFPSEANQCESQTSNFDRWPRLWVWVVLAQFYLLTRDNNPILILSVIHLSLCVPYLTPPPLKIKEKKEITTMFRLP